MNQMVEKWSYFSLARSYYEDIGNFILSMSSEYGVNARAAIPYVILGFVCLLVYVSRPKPTSPDSLLKPKPKSYDRTRSWIIREIHSGKLVLDRLVEGFNKAQVNPATLANTENVLKALLEEELLDLIKLQQTVAKLEMSGREDSAVKILEEAAKKAYDAKKPHEAYEIEMLLVEMLIYKGELDKASKCKCLKDESIKDARRPLYKAIIYKMLVDTKERNEKEKKAKECWEEFVEVQDPQLKEVYLSQTNFEAFKESVGRLQSATRVCREN
ncbi:uncharacterized protein LOC133297342 [Gastrolobium bilobum]|uniref:uncharacterized protein LOC133297342 n=1 Tax=Gastrolobium bilobum TaxID=150636 RepID=UPI002AB10389|nr:uncharacterized protein LOC133297342 [Gastrolobium bilobum]